MLTTFSLCSAKDLRRKSHSLQVMVVERSDEVKPEPETPSAVTVRLFENAKDFELTNDVLS